jgi:hypothetical protein
MSQYASSSTSAHTVVATNKLSIPIGTNLADPNTRTLAPSLGGLAYNSTDNLIYYGSGGNGWNSVGSGTQGSTGATGGIPSIVTNLTVTNLTSTNATINNLTIPSFNPAGVVHNDSSGFLSSSLVVNADIGSGANISDTKLATISTAGKVANSATTAVNTNTPNTIVLRDGSGNFSAGNITANLTGNVLGSASNNVLKAGDSMSGTLNMLAQNEIRFQDTSGGQYVGINAQSIVPSSYTLSLPTTIPTASQIIRANSVTPTNLEWITQGGSITPANSEVIYVAKYGNDVTGNGSFDTPYATLSQAISVANTLASSFNPIAIFINPGIYIENNSSGPLTITAQGISIVGYAADTTTFIPNTLSNDLLLVNETIEFSNVGFIANGMSTATCISLTVGAFSSFNNIQTFNFNIGVSCSGVNNTYVFNNCLFVQNGTGVFVNNAAVELNTCSVLGSTNFVVPAGIGLSVTGANGTLIINGGTCSLCQTGLLLQNNSGTTANAISFKLSAFDIVQTTAAQSTISSCTFEITSDSGDIEMQVSGAGTKAIIIGSEFNGNNSLGVPQAIALVVTDNAIVDISSSTIRNYTVGMQIGTTSDTSSTVLSASGVTVSNCGTDLLQKGSTTLNFNAGTATSDKISINDATNVALALFDVDNKNALTIGSTADQDTALIVANVSVLDTVQIDYLPSLYSTKALGYINKNNVPISWYVLSQNSANLTAITTNRTQVAGLRLVSDTASPVGGTSALRGWDINKNASTAELSFNYQNSDPLLLGLKPQYTIMQLDGENNLLQLPTNNTQIVFSGDTNFYRSAASVLKTDGNFIVGGLTPNRVVVTDAVTNELISSIVTNTELGYLSGVTSSIQTQLNNKVSRSGDTMTGTLQLPAGSTALPSLIFTGSTSSGLSANTGNLSFSTNALERLRISSGGIISIDTFTMAGIVHNNASGDLSSSLIVNADIDASAAITDTKLATISTASKVANSATTATNLNNANTIVSRDPSGNFSAGTITANLTGTVTGHASLDLPLTGGTLTGALTLPAGSSATPSLLFSGGTNTGISAGTPNTLSIDVNGVEIMNISSSGVTVDAFNTAGVVHNNASGLLSSSLITNSDITNATITNAKLSSISSSNVANAIVVRDGSGNFSTNEITIIGTVTNPTDAATKAYVDAAVSTGLVIHTPAVVVSLSNQTLTGFPTIDGVTFPSGTNRVLLTGQTNPIENGLWVVAAGAWTRPADFATGTAAGEAYVLILSGNTEAGSAWLCSTPSAIIDTDPISFQLFSLPDTTTGANVGAGTGQIFQSKTGATLNFRTLLQGDAHTVISTGSDTVSVSTDATSANTASTIVARDASGNFSATTIAANLTGSASNNVLKAGDSMTGTLNMLTQNEIRFQDASGGQYVGINAQSIVPSSYTLSLPTTIPTASQIIRANSVTPTNLEWFTEGGSVSPVSSQTIFVAKYGDDTTGNGSFDSPYITLSKAISVANTLASSSNPINILISAGIYVENNSSGALTIISNGISIVGMSSTSVIIIPNTPTNNLFSIGNAVIISNITLESSSPLATAISISAVGLTVFENVYVYNFLVGILCSGNATSSYGFNNCLFIGNIAATNINDVHTEFNSCTFFGTSSLVGPASNTGIVATGSGALVIISGGVVGVCTTGIHITNNSIVSVNGVSFRINAFDIIQDGGSRMTLAASTIELTNSSADIDIQISGAGTIADIIGCEFNGNDQLGSPQGIGLIVSDNATVNISSGTISNYVTGIQVGVTIDTSSTKLQASSFTIGGCTTDIIQEGSSTLVFNGGVATANNITINDSTNVSLAFFDVGDNNILTIGSFADTNTSLIQAGINNTNHPEIQYRSSLYSTQAIGFNNVLPNPSSLFVLSQNNANITSITTNRANISGLRLVSDTGSPVGGTSALRGWDINKNATTGNLSFNYQNSDAIGQTIIPQYEVMNIDGVNNRLNLSSLTQIIFGGDTDIYRSSAAVLKTDGNFIVGGLTPNRAVVTDSITNQLSSSAVTTTELGYLSGVTSSIQTQLNNKVSRSGDTMTGTLQLPAGSTASPSLIFTGSLTAGLSANTGNLSFSTNALERLRISSGGAISINAFTVAGIVHNDASGNLSSSLIVNADIDAAANIIDTKLATISTAGKVANSATTAVSTNTPSAIVLRDPSGNFSANIITATLNGSSSGFSGSLNGDVTGTQTSTIVSFVGGQSASNVAAATVLANNATSSNTASAIVRRDASGNFSAGTITATLNGSSIGFTGSLLGDVTGTQTSTIVSFVGGQSASSVAAATVLANGASSSNVANTIVKRDASGNFSAGTITATLNGSSTGFSGSLSGDVTGTQSATVVSLVGGQSATNVASATVLANNATNLNTASAIVRRDASGNFSAGTITASITGASSLNVLKTGDTMTGTLTLPAGSATTPSLQFTGSTNTGISAGTANTLSFDTNGVQRMSMNTATINTSLPFVIGTLFANTSSESVTVNGNNQSFAVQSTTSILIITLSGSRTGFTITFPASPTNGQFFSVLLTNTNQNVTIVNNGNGGTVVNGITTLDATAALLASTGGTSVTYIYNTAANSWYRFLRG